MNANGKVDRKALPEPDLASGSQYEPPQGEVEEVLAQIWSEVLGVERVGRHDNFFEMGGDSILTLQVVAKARDEGWKLSPKQLFEFPSVMALALVTSASQTFTDEEELDSEVPLLPIQSWFFDMSLSARHHWNQTVLLESREQLYIAPLKSALHALVAHHDALRLRYRQDTDGRWVQFYARVTPETDGEVLWVRQAANAGEVEALCNQAQLSMDFKLKDRCCVHWPSETADGSWRLLLTIHHLVVDGVSWRILLDDLQVAYTQEIVAKTSSCRRRAVATSAGQTA